MLLVDLCDNHDFPAAGGLQTGRRCTPPCPAACGFSDRQRRSHKQRSAQTASPYPVTPQAYETNASDLLAMRLPSERCGDGWLRLFDGHTLFGWEIAGSANWRIEDQSIVVDDGDRSLLCTSTDWLNYELSLEFKSDPTTNSGVFVRSPLQPENVATECYEINIAAADNPFPSGSIVERQKVDEQQFVESSGDWQAMNITVNAATITVSIDNLEVMSFTDPTSLPAGRIGLQHNSGRIAFRNIQLKPLGLENMIDEGLSQWKRYPEMSGSFEVGAAGELLVDGGKTQLETTTQYDDFVLLANYKLPADDINTGIFFRCIPGAEMMGYECQVNDGIIGGNPLQPADCGTGGIFRRQDARIVVGETGQFNSVVLSARGKHFAAWVNGIPVSNWTDDRPADENPRRGARTAAGTIMIQGHDPATQATYKTLQVAP